MFICNTMIKLFKQYLNVALLHTVHDEKMLMGTKPLSFSILTCPAGVHTKASNVHRSTLSGQLILT